MERPERTEQPGALPEDALEGLAPAEREGLEEIARQLRGRGLPETFVRAALRATAETLRSLAAPPHPTEEAFRREEVRRFLEQTGARRAGAPEPVRKETRGALRERKVALIQDRIREASKAHARHEVKKTRQRLLRIDQRRLRRELGREGEELCREINAVLRRQAGRLR